MGRRARTDLRGAAVEILRTPDERFVDLPGYPFEPHYVDVTAGGGSNLRMHYLDEGPPDGALVLLLHGEPSWSYLYRTMIPVLVAAGLRAVAIDLVGFGRSDKPASRADYTYQAHVDWTWASVEAIGLQAITLVCQDWGGLIGLRLVGEHPERFARVVAANTYLPTGDRDPGEAFLAWRRYSQETPELRVGRIVSGGCVNDLAPDVVAAYDAPFPDDTHKEGARQFPLLVPTRPDDPAAPANRRAWESLRRFERPFLCAFSDSDAITAGADAHTSSRRTGARSSLVSLRTSSPPLLYSDTPHRAFPPAVAPSWGVGAIAAALSHAPFRARRAGAPRAWGATGRGATGSCRQALTAWRYDQPARHRDRRLPPLRAGQPGAPPLRA